MSAALQHRPLLAKGPTEAIKAGMLAGSKAAAAGAPRAGGARAGAGRARAAAGWIGLTFGGGPGAKWPSCCRSVCACAACVASGGGCAWAGCSVGATAPAVVLASFAALSFERFDARSAGVCWRLPVQVGVFAVAGATVAEAAAAAAGAAAGVTAVRADGGCCWR